MDSYTCLKILRKKFFMKTFKMKKKATVEIKPKLLIVMTDIQDPERYNSCQWKICLPFLPQKLSSTSTLLTNSTTSVCTWAVYCQRACTCALALYRPRGPLKLWKKIKNRKSKPGRDHWYWEPGSLEGPDTFFNKNKRKQYEENKNRKTNQYEVTPKL